MSRFSSPHTGTVLSVISLMVGALGLLVGIGGLSLAVHVTRELHQVEYTVRHNVGDPEATDLGYYRVVYDQDANGKLIPVPCAEDPKNTCDHQHHLERQSAWTEMEHQEDQIHALEAKTENLSEWDVDFLHYYMDKQVTMAEQDEWLGKHDLDEDGIWNYGVRIDACPTEPGEYPGVPDGHDDSEAYGCPDVNNDDVADKFQSAADLNPPAEVADTNPPVVQGPLDGDVGPGEPGFDEQVLEFCANIPKPEQRADGKFYLTGCTEGGSTYVGITYVCTSFDAVYPYLHDCGEIR